MTVDSNLNGLRHHEAVVNGIRMHYVERGSGPLIVLLHGFPEFWYSWRYQIEALAPHFRVVAPDQRGYNLSEKPHGVDAYRLTHLTADVAALIRHLGEEQAVIVGHDWGGGVAWAFARAYPEMTRRLIALDCPHPEAMLRALRSGKQLRKSWYMFFFQLPFLPEAMLRARNFAAIERAFNRPARPDTFTENDIRAYKDALARPGALTAAVNWYRAAFRSAVRSRGARGAEGRVTAPAMLIWAEDDPFFVGGLAEQSRRWASDLRIERIPDTGHWVQQERPELVSRLIISFLDDLDQRTASGRS